LQEANPVATGSPIEPVDDWDIDTDGDGVLDSWDNCWYVANPNQSDCDGSGVLHEDGSRRLQQRPPSFRREGVVVHV
jgi:hypothetical protein